MINPDLIHLTFMHLQALEHFSHVNTISVLPVNAYYQREIFLMHNTISK